jgi:hypothetical protein
MKDQAVGYQMVVLDGLALLIAAVFRDDALTAEKGPFEKPIQRLAFVGGSLDGGS